MIFALAECGKSFMLAVPVKAETLCQEGVNSAMLCER
jgi:hypothetical protein